MYFCNTWLTYSFILQYLKERVLGECRPPQRDIIIHKWEKPDYFLYPDTDDRDPDHSDNLMGYKLDQNTSSEFFS